MLYNIMQLPATLVEILGHLQLELPSHVQTGKTYHKCTITRLERFYS